MQRKQRLQLAKQREDEKRRAKMEKLIVDATPAFVHAERSGSRLLDETEAQKRQREETQRRLQLLKARKSTSRDSIQSSDGRQTDIGLGMSVSGRAVPSWRAGL
jgi:hypothetical protein